MGVSLNYSLISTFTVHPLVYYCSNIGTVLRDWCPWYYTCYYFHVLYLVLFVLFSFAIFLVLFCILLHFISHNMVIFF